MDETVFPSFFNFEARGAIKLNESLADTPLRVGEIKEIIYPDDKNSLSKSYVEYTVEVVQRNGASSSSSTLYHGCVSGQLFGGFADQFHYTLRKDEKKQGQESTAGVGVGGKVLMMCINGHKANAVILCGLPDSTFVDDDKANHAKDLGHNLLFEFNGCKFTVNKDGELELKFRGATKVDGTLADSAVADAEGTSLTIDKEGSFKVATPKDDQFIHINHKDKKIDIQAQKEWNVTIKGEVKIEADKNVKILSSGTLIGSATDAMLLANTYRNSETQMNTKVSAAATSLATLLATAGASITTAAPLNAIPIVGGGLAAAAFAAAGVALTSAGPICSQITAAITAFEGPAATYLSPKNKND